MKSNIEIKKTGITNLNVDAIVNAANEELQEGGGVCGAIFSEAGSNKLTGACREIGHCKTGDAVITPGFNLLAKYIIHAVGPIWYGGNDNEGEILYSAYRQSLILAKENNCHSIAFPLISSGIYGYPKNEAWKIAIKSCHDFICDNLDYDINIFFAVLNDENKEMGEKTIKEIVE